MSPIRSILIVEDEPAIADLVKFHLEQDGFEVTVAPEGRRALALLEKRIPSLVVLDIMLPDVDGIEILRRLRGRDETANLPVIMLTAKA